MSSGALVYCKTLRSVGSSFPLLLCLLLICVDRATAAASKCNDGPLCSYMASEGECEADPENMLTECPRACKNPCLCDVSAFTNDTACDCLVRAKNDGYCNSSQALIDCPTTCSKVTHESCPPLQQPTDPNAGLSTWSTHYLVTVTEVCRPGYMPLVDRNQGKKLCSAQGQWVTDYANGDPVECTGVDCGNPPTTANTFFVATDTTFKSTVDYVCAGSCVPESGQKTLVCNASGLWEGQPLACKRVDCGSPPSSPNATKKVTNTTLAGTATYSCAPGYTSAQGDTSLHCNASGIWHGNLVTCKVIDCNDPPSIPHTHIQLSGTTFNQSANYSCLPGFEYERGQFQLICGLSGNWTGEALKCKIVDCGVPPADVSLIVEVTNTTFGHVASYSCRNGFTFSSGDSNLTCDLEGNWAGNLMKCLASQNPLSPVKSGNATDMLIPLVVGVVVFIAVIIALIIFVFMNMETFSKNKKLRKAATTFRKNMKSIFNFKIWINDKHKPHPETGDRLAPHKTTSATSLKSVVLIQVKDSGNFHSMDKASNINVKDSGNCHSTIIDSNVKSSFPPILTNYLSPTYSLAKPPSTHSMTRSLSSITVSSLSQRTTPEYLPQVTS